MKSTQLVCSDDDYDYGRDDDGADDDGGEYDYQSLVLHKCAILNIRTTDFATISVTAHDSPGVSMTMVE